MSKYNVLIMLYETHLGRSFSEEQFSELVVKTAQIYENIEEEMVRTQADIEDIFRMLDEGIKQLEKTKGTFQHHRLMAGYYEILQRKLWDTISDFKRSSDPSLKTAIKDMEKEELEIDKKKLHHWNLAKDLFNPKVHGDWNDTLPTEEKCRAYGEKFLKSSKVKSKGKLESDYFWPTERLDIELSDLHARFRYNKYYRALRTAAKKHVGKWSEADAIDFYTQGMVRILDQLPLIDASRYKDFQPLDNLPYELQKKIFILKKKGYYYFVDTQECDYAKYVVRLDKYLD